MSPSSARKVRGPHPPSLSASSTCCFVGRPGEQPTDSTQPSLRLVDPLSLKLPPAIEATHALLSLILPRACTPVAYLKIASELGLPLALVQLRHRATHEDLPSLTVLLESANMALDWLYAHYWVPRLNDIEGTGQARKRAMLDTQSIPPTLTQIDHWIGSAARELPALCSILSERQVLVPQAVKKRCQSLKDPLPESLKNLYEPLLDHLAQSYPQLFIRLLVSTLLDILSAIPEEEPGKNKQADSTYYYTCAAWLFYLLLRVDGGTMGQEALRSLLMKPNQYTLSIVERLKKQANQSDWFVEGAISPLIDVLHHTKTQAHQGENLMDESIDIGIAAMKQRWESLVTKEEELVNEGGSTWKLVPETNWAPCPIGCLPDQTVPDLYKAFVQPS
ncbi:hypothetical protein H4Q26_013746 [Puccinia striiformis f. sp. tritici PST-130]|nr:hypothetical protein H4Q26_013746 [Puccinia striiformis f. sp. tritici PST-130]